MDTPTAKLARIQVFAPVLMTVVLIVEMIKTMMSMATAIFARKSLSMKINMTMTGITMTRFTQI